MKRGGSGVREDQGFGMIRGSGCCMSPVAYRLTRTDTSIVLISLGRSPPNGSGIKERLFTAVTVQQRGRGREQVGNDGLPLQTLSYGTF